MSSEAKIANDEFQEALKHLQEVWPTRQTNFDGIAGATRIVRMYARHIEQDGAQIMKINEYIDDDVRKILQNNQFLICYSRDSNFCRISYDPKSK